MSKTIAKTPKTVAFLEKCLVQNIGQQSPVAITITLILYYINWMSEAEKQLNFLITCLVKQANYDATVDQIINFVFSIYCSQEIGEQYSFSAFVDEYADEQALVAEHYYEPQNNSSTEISPETITVPAIEPLSNNISELTHSKRIELKQRLSETRKAAEKEEYYVLCDLAMDAAGDRQSESGKKAEKEAKIAKNAEAYANDKSEINLILKLSDRINHWSNMGLWKMTDLEKWKEGTYKWGHTQRIEALSLPKALAFGAIAHFKSTNIIPSTTQIKEYREVEDKSILLEDKFTDETAKQRIVDRAKDPEFTREKLDEIIKPALAAKQLESPVEAEEVLLTNSETKELLIDYGYKPIRGFFRKSVAQRKAEQKSGVQKLRERVEEIAQLQKPSVSELLAGNGIFELIEALQKVGFNVVKTNPSVA